MEEADRGWREVPPLLHDPAGWHGVRADQAWDRINAIWTFFERRWPPAEPECDTPIVVERPPES